MLADCQTDDLASAAVCWSCLRPLAPCAGFQDANCSRVALKAIRSAITFRHLDDAQSWLRKALGRVISLRNDLCVSSSRNTGFGHRRAPRFNFSSPSGMKFGSLPTQSIVLRIHMKHSRIWWTQVSSKTLQSDVKPHATKNLWVNLSPSAVTVADNPMALLISTSRRLVHVLVFPQ